MNRILKPWVTEPDSKRWVTKDGIECVVKRMPMGYLCGYVRADAWKGNIDNTINLDVHGGITFSGELDGEEGFWLGFDCAHFGDLMPYTPMRDGRYKTIEFVMEECELLAKQIVATPE